MGEIQRELMLHGETSGSKNKLKVLSVVSDELQNDELHLFFKAKHYFWPHTLLSYLVK